MSIRVIAQSNAFTTKRTEKSFEQGVSLQNILDGLSIGSDNPVRISINGEQEADLTTIPALNSLVLVKVVPTGEDEATQSTLSAADFILSSEENIVAYASLVTSSGHTFSSATAAEMLNSASSVDPSYVNTNAPTTNYLSGGTNGFKKDGIVPVILGKHRYYPYKIAFPFVEFACDNTIKVGEKYSSGYAKPFVQKLHQVYLWGHKEVIPDISTYKRKDTLLSNLTGTASDDDALGYYGKKAKKFLNINKTLKAYIRDVKSTNNGFTTIQVILPDNISYAATTLVFGNFYSYAQDLKSGYLIGVNPVARVEISLYKTNDEFVSSTEYRIAGPKRQPSDTPSVTSSTIDTVIPDSTQQYYLLVRRLNDNPKDNPAQWPNTDPDTVKSPYYSELVEDFAIDCQLTHVTCTGILDVISTSAQETFKYTDLVLTDIDKDTGTNVSVLTGDVGDFNAIVQTQVPVYNGTPTGTATSWNTTALTSNPAAMFLYVLQGAPNVRPVSDDLIDWEVLEDWYDFCEEQKFACNLVLENPGTIETILTLICTTGRASFNMTDLYSVIIDKPRLFATQMFTNKNSFGITSSRTLLNDVHAIEYSFINENADYQAETGWEYREGYNADGSDGKIKATLKQSESVVGMTNSDQVSSMIKYSLNCAERRVDTLTASMDVEYLLCKRGDLVYVAYDELLQGLARGRVKEVTMPTTEVTEIVLDELVTFEVGETYGIVIRISDEVQTTPLPVVNPASVIAVETNVLTFSPAIALPIEAGSLYTFGVTGKEKEDYIVVSIVPSKSLTAAVTLMNYAPEVYDLGTLTPFVSKVSLPAGFGSSLLLSSVYSLDELAIQTQGQVDQINTVVTPSLKDAIKGTVPSAFYIRSDILELKLSNNYLYFVDKTDLKVYRTTTLVNAAREVIIDEPVKNFAIDLDDEYIVYSSLVNGNNLYKKDLSTSEVTLVTSVASTQPVLTSASQVLYINNSDQNKVYLTSIEDDTTGTLISNFPTTSIDITAIYLTWMDSETGFIYIKDIYDGDLTFRGVVFREIASTNIIASPPGLWGVNTLNAVPIYVDSSTQISYVNEEAYYGEVSRHAMDIRGNYVFVTFSGDVYYAALFGSYANQARLDLNIVTQGFGENIICSTESGSNKLTNITTEDIDVFSVGNTLTGVGIPTGTKVTIVGSGYVVMDEEATITNTSASVNVAGTIQCALTLGDNKVRNISPEDIIQFSWNDSLTGLGIQDDTLVKFVGTDYVIMSTAATITDPTAAIDVFGTRLLIDANKVVITGSIQARLLETNAINSIDRVPSTAPENVGEQLYQHNLTTGNELRFTNDGELVYEFTNDTGLALKNGVSILQDDGAGTSFGLDGDGKLTCSGATINGDGVFTGDLIVDSDNANRKVEIGSKGLKVTDFGSRVVHDLPSTGLTNYTYYGHPFAHNTYKNSFIAYENNAGTETYVDLTLSSEEHSINFAYQSIFTLSPVPPAGSYFTTRIWLLDSEGDPIDQIMLNTGIITRTGELRTSGFASIVLTSLQSSQLKRVYLQTRAEFTSGYTYTANSATVWIDKVLAYI